MNTEVDSVRRHAFRILNRVIYKGAYPDLALEGVFKGANLSSRDAAFLTELVYGVLRWLGRLDYVINVFVGRKVKKKEVLNILRLGVYQLLFLDGVSDYAAVSETVNLAKAAYGEKIGGFTNAVLREILRGKDAIRYPTKEGGRTRYVEVNYSFPGWLVEKWQDAFGFEYTEELCNSLNRVSPLTARVNTLKTTREGLIYKLRGRNVEAAPTEYSPGGITFSARLDPASLPEFRSGLFAVQDEGAQLISYLLEPKPGETILDACSAPGGKSTHIAEFMANEGQVVALDINKSRLKLVQDQANRLGIGSIRTVHGDASSAEALRSLDDKLFDKILVDAPCSGLGTIRRNPDAKWKKSPQDVLELSQIQFKILSEVSRTLKPDGIMVFAVCTLMPEENERVCERFLYQNPEFKVDTEIKSTWFPKAAFFTGNGFFTADPVKHNTDGFFAARFRKNRP